MINSLLAVGLLAIMGVGANKPTPINLKSQETTKNLKNKNNVNDSGVQNFSLRTNETAVTQRPYIDFEADSGIVVQHTKWYGSNYNTVMQIESATYEENVMEMAIENPYYNPNDISSSQYIPAYDFSDLTVDGWAISCMKVIKVDPNIPSGATNLTTKLAVSLKPFLTSPYPQWSVTYSTRVQIYTSTNSAWENVVSGNYNGNWYDMENPYTEKGYNQEVYEYINNPANGFNYSYAEQTVETEQAREYVQDQVEATQDISLINGTRNYIVVFYRTEAFYNGSTLSHTNQAFSDATIQPNTVQDVADWSRIYHSDPIFITGSYFAGTITQEVIDLPGLIWEILSMPFAFISTAFNLTIFPGTPYSLNISNLILTIFGVLVFIFILKILTKGR